MSKKSGVMVISLAYWLMTCGMLVGCGTKGPLYIPEQRYPQAATVKPNSASKVETNTSGSSQHTGQ